MYGGRPKGNKLWEDTYSKKENNEVKKHYILMFIFPSNNDHNSDIYPIILQG